MSGGRAPKRKGDEWERRVRDYFRDRGYRAERRYGAGRNDDVGDLDVAAWIPLLVECKAAARSERARWIDALWHKIRREGWEGEILPVIVERRRSQGVENAYVTLDLRTFVDLLDEVASRATELARTTPEKRSR